VTIFCLGEVLVDCLGGSRFPGGAPANVAYHVAALGQPAEIVSRVGEDAAGRKLTGWLGSHSVGKRFLQIDPGPPTGSVNVLPGPRYEIAAPAAWDFIERTDAASVGVGKAGALVFGTLAQRQPVSRGTIRAMVETARAAGVPALCDLNLRASFFDEETILWSLRHCDVLKMNREELDIVSGLLGAAGVPADLFAGLLREFGIARGVLTEGEKGALICEDGCVSRHAAEAVPNIADTVGAGDAYTAVLAVALARGTPLSTAAAPAAALSAFVVSKPGATPAIPSELVARINAMLGV
jgi:fructokinase